MKFKWYVIVFKIVTDKRFRFWLGGTLKYSITNYDDKLGTGASDVPVFWWKYSSKIVKESK